MNALLVVDVQNDFCPGGALETPEGDQIIPTINRLMPTFDMVIASRDWHPPQSVHFKKWPPHCVRETEGAQYHPELNTDNIDIALFKGTGNKDDGYSVFEATNVDLTNALYEKGVEELYVCGLTTEFCVKETAIQGAQSGIKTYAITDAMKGVKHEENSEQKAFEEMQNNHVHLTNSEKLI